MKPFSNDSSVEIMSIYTACFINSAGQRILDHTDFEGTTNRSHISLWDYIEKPIVLNVNKSLDYLDHKENVLMIKNYTVPVYEVTIHDIGKYISTFDNDDLYFFDSTLSWTIVLTHEYIEKNRRYCILKENC